jgi:hypothetical protein
MPEVSSLWVTRVTAILVWTTCERVYENVHTVYDRRADILQQAIAVKIASALQSRSCFPTI